MGEINVYKILLGKPEEKRAHGIMSGWENSIRMDLTEIGCQDVDQIEQSHVAGSGELSGSIKVRRGRFLDQWSCSVELFIVCILSLDWNVCS
jgi:hypothetical protein